MCSQLKNEIRDLGKMIKNEPTKQDYKVTLSQLKQSLKRLVKKNKTIYKHRILD